MTFERAMTIVAVDPGRAKCGIAALSGDGEVLARSIVVADQVGLAAAALAQVHGAAVIVLGGRTGSSRAWELIDAAAPEMAIAQIEEHMSTLEARQRYWRENPPGCLMRLLPEGLRTPPVPIDDWAAVVLAERYLAAQSGSPETTRRPNTDDQGRV